MIKTHLIAIALIFTSYSWCQPPTVDNIVLITLDGLRWQELYGGAVDSMMLNEDLVKEPELLMKRFSAGTTSEARKKLMPWFWSTLVEEGQLYGNRWLGNKMVCTNRFWFSYPGYNEILTGFSDPLIDSNAKKYNDNKTILEWLHDKPEFAGKVAAFGSWDVFPFIINDERSGIPVNAGFRKAKDEYLTYTEQLLNDLQDQIPSPWSTVRLDAFTHNYAMEYLKKHHPRVAYISYGETDDFAHDGRYDHYLNSAHQTDQWIESVWEYLQADPFYQGKTAMIITTDHGRGSSPMEEWKSHGTIYKGSNQIWAAAIGPNIPPLGEVATPTQLTQSQIASTLAKLLGYDYSGGKYEAGEVIETMIK
jgi:hypothetical protein